MAMRYEMTTRMQHEAILRVLRDVEREHRGGFAYHAPTREVAARTPWSILTVLQRLRQLHDDGRVLRTGDHRHYRWRIAYLEDDDD